VLNTNEAPSLIPSSGGEKKKETKTENQKTPLKMEKDCTQIVG
jgi:hypothetical protein